MVDKCTSTISRGWRTRLATLPVTQQQHGILNQESQPRPQPSGSPFSLYAKWTSVLSENRSLLPQLEGIADEWMSSPVLSIVHKRHPAPSGDPHDYVSRGPYWWADPNSADGLPYIRRDGQVNPEYYEYDSVVLQSLCIAVPHLVLYALGAESTRHAEQAGKLLRGWFLDPATRMNPHLNYAQGIPGITEGRAIGIIDTTPMVLLIEAIKKLPFNSEWTPENLCATKDWFSQYLDWLLESPFGPRERDEPNNHGTWYDAQVVSFALFCERPEIARHQIETFTLPRVLNHITPDGEQPRELRRTLSWSYCTYNLCAFAWLATFARDLDIDLWAESGPAQGRIVRAMDWLLPYYLGEKEWTGQQIHPFDRSGVALLSYLFWLGTKEERFMNLCTKIDSLPWQRFLSSKSNKGRL